MRKILIHISIVFIVLNITACSENKTAEQYITQAKSYIAVNDTDSAVIELKNAVRIAPKNPKARLYLGKAYLEQGSYLNAEKELERSLELGVNVGEVVVSLIQVKSKLNKPKEVYQLVEESAELSDDKYILALTFAGITALNEGDREKAQDYLGQAISLSENSPYSKVAKAYLSQSESEYSTGLSVIDELLLNSPEISEALLLKGHLLFALKDYRQASEVFALYRKNHPLAHYIRFFEINSVMQTGNVERAEVLVDKLLVLFKNAPLANQYKAQLEYRKKNFKQAKQFAELAIQQGGDSYAVARIIAGISAYQLQDMEQAYNYLKPIEANLSLSHPVKKILALIKLKLGYTSEAAETLEQIEDISEVDTRFLQASSLELMKAGDFKSAKSLLEKADKASPENASIIAQKGFLLLSQKDLAGVKALELALKLDPSLKEVELSLAMQYLNNGQDDKATSIAKKWLGSNENKVSGYVLQGIINTKKKLYEKAKVNFRKVLDLEPDNVAALYNLAIFADNDANYSIAIDFYQKVLNAQPAHRGAIQRLSQLQIKHNKVSDTIVFLQTLIKENPENINLTIGLAQNLRLNGKVEQAISLLENFTYIDKYPPSYWIVLGDSYIQLKDFAKANEVYKKASIALPRNYLISLRNIGMLEVEKNFSEALKSTKQTYKDFPNDSRLEVLLAYFELKNNNNRNAAKYLSILEGKRITHPFIDSVSGELAISNKQYEKAIDYFTIAYQKKPTGMNAITLARVLKFDGKAKEAEKTLEKYLDSNGANIRVRMLLAELYDRRDRGKIIEQYMKVLEIQPNNIVVLNNLAWSQYKVGQFDKAIINIEKAYKLGPKNLAVIESYGVILVAKNQFYRGIELLENAIMQGSTDENVKISLAKAREFLNK